MQSVKSRFKKTLSFVDSVLRNLLFYIILHVHKVWKESLRYMNSFSCMSSETALIFFVITFNEGIIATYQVKK